MNRRVAINLGVFVAVFALMIWWAVNNIITVDAIERPYSISAEFEQAAGVQKESEVTYLGVHYGRVSNVERIVGGVDVTMKIDRGKELPEGSIARIFRKSAIGEPYIDFIPPEGYDPDADGVIPAGGHIALDEGRTTVPLEFSELLRSANALLSSIDPEQAGSLVHELALALDGRAQDLRDLTTSFDTLTATFAARTDQLDRLARNSTKVTGVLATHRLSLGRSLTNLKEVAAGLRAAKGDLQVLLRDGPGFLTTTADLVADEKQALDCLLGDLTPLLQEAPKRLDSVQQLLELGPTGFGYIFNSLDREADGPWLRINLVPDVTGEPARTYTPRPSLPVVPTISPCASTLTPAALAAAGVAPTGGAARAASASAVAGATGRPATLPRVEGPAGILATTGGQAAVAGAVVALVAAGALLVLRRRLQDPA